MFEQSILAGHPTNKGLGFAVSLSAQVLVLSIAVLIPLIYTSKLTLVPLATPLTVPSAPPAAPQAVAQHSAARAPRVASTVFVAPQLIPATIANIVDAPAAMEPPSTGFGVPGGIGTAGGLSALNNLLTKTAPPPREGVKPPIVQTNPVRVSRGVQEAKLIRKVVPEYPPLARQARISGVVHLIGIIAKNGTIRNLQVLSGHPLLVGAALNAVRQWVYQPTLLSGEPVEVICPIDVNFTLN